MTPHTLSPSAPHSLADEDEARPPSTADGAETSTTSAACVTGAAEAMLGQRLVSAAGAADPVTVSGLRRETYRRFELWGLDEESCYLMQLAFAELGTNVIEHGPTREDAWIQVTWAVQQVPGQLPRAVVSVLDAGDGVSRRRTDPDLPGVDDCLPVLPTGQRGLRMLLRSGVRIERVTLSASPGWPGGHLVSAWTPLDLRSRQRVCACPCWEHGHAVARCQQIVAGGRHRLRGVDGESIACCRSCAPALRAALVRVRAMQEVCAAAGEAAELVTRLGAQASRLCSAITEARHVGVAAVDIAAVLRGLGRSEDLLEIAYADRDGSRLLWQLAAALAVSDESGTGDRAAPASHGDVLAVSA